MYNGNVSYCAGCGSNNNYVSGGSIIPITPDYKPCDIGISYKVETDNSNYGGTKNYFDDVSNTIKDISDSPTVVYSSNALVPIMNSSNKEMEVLPPVDDLVNFPIRNSNEGSFVIPNNNNGNNSEIDSTIITQLMMEREIIVREKIVMKQQRVQRSNNNQNKRNQLVHKNENDNTKVIDISSR